jgi:poly-gamma-glutamate capsule biosynthesis protein CapA/YwtB (metallophosphatase superfamily)
MTVADLVKSLMKSEMSIEQVWEKTQAICTQYDIDPAALDDANAQFVAGEIDKENAGFGLTTVENNGQLATNEEPKAKKNKKNTPATTTSNQGIENLKVAVQNLRATVANESDAMYEISDRKSTEVENAAAARIVNRYKQISPNIVSKVSAGLQEYADESASFRGQIGSIFDEAFADIVNN